eukprot:Pgem_evm1s19161
MLFNGPNNDADLCLTISSGEIVNDKETKKKTWRDHYAKLGNENNDDSFCYEFKNDIENTLSRYDILSGVADPDPILDAVFTAEEVSKCISNLKTHKAGGADELTNDLLNKLCNTDNGKIMFTKVINCLWVNEHLSDDLKIGRIVNIFKDGY